MRREAGSRIAEAVKRKSPQKDSGVDSLTQDSETLLRQSQQLRSVRQEVSSTHTRIGCSSSLITNPATG